ncbi:MAG: hypothetical protein ACTJG4_11165 [Vreelandella alkaliphila]|uniref:Uncharacterized protein n=1 Tax=Halomonas campaniensis TaxID=213554 RepID=A0A3D0KK55_9GAMM|nr:MULTISPECIES: hypothetical protein [unclassified Halomonas]HBP42282.1 hypothetical protein [Halomonas sp.]HBS81550.1 hypothetical protein [Halomonas campaniensis]HCA03670.1 hypothetical protein [Halomonas campaniensis]
MAKLPKSIVIEGRRYPTWALSAKSRKQLINLDCVDAHIAELHQRLAHHYVAREHYQLLLASALPKPHRQPSVSETTRSFWQSVSKEWAQKHWPTRTATLSLITFESTGHYRQGDRVLCYVKGHGVVGWGVVEIDIHSTKRHLAWRVSVPTLDKALPAKALKEFSLRHPSRSSQLLPAAADIEGLLSALAAKAA